MIDQLIQFKQYDSEDLQNDSINVSQEIFQPVVIRLPRSMPCQQCSVMDLPDNSATNNARCIV